MTTMDPFGLGEKCKPKLKTINNRKPKCSATVWYDALMAGAMFACLFICLLFVLSVCFVCLLSGQRQKLLTASENFIIIYNKSMPGAETCFNFLLCRLR